jgi:hypothetical protein
MKTKNQKRSVSILQVTGSLIWAALILICSVLLKDSDKNQLGSNVRIIGSVLQFSLLGYFANNFLQNKGNA